MAIKDQQVEEETEKLSGKQVGAEPPENSEKKSKHEKHLREIETLESELELERRKSADLGNRMRYLQADIANLQRQSDRRVSEVRNQVKLTWILEILSIKEDLDRAVAVAKENREKSTLLDGLLLVTSRIENILKLESVEVVRAEVGEIFDPLRHEALSYQESDSEENGTILAVISPGYLVDGKVIKPAMVEVARRKQSEGEESPRTERPAEEFEIEEPTGSKES